MSNKECYEKIEYYQNLIDNSNGFQRQRWYGKIADLKKILRNRGVQI